MESSCWCGTLCWAIGVVCRPIVAMLPHPKGHGGPVAYATCAPTRWMCGKATSVFWKSRTRTGQSADHWFHCSLDCSKVPHAILLDQTSQFFDQSWSPLSFHNDVSWCLLFFLRKGGSLFVSFVSVCVLYFRGCCGGVMGGDWRRAKESSSVHRGCSVGGSGGCFCFGRCRCC